MKILGFIIFLILFSITNAFTQECLYGLGIGLDKSANFAQSGLSYTCLLQKQEYKCLELEDKLDQSEKYKIIQCDNKSLNQNSIGNMSLGGCIIDGLKLSGEQLLDLAKLPGQIAGAIVQGFHDEKLCYADIAKKREMLNAFNLSIKDPRFKLSEQFTGRWLEDATCAEIDKLLNARYNNYINTMMRERKAAIDTGKKVAPIESSKDGADILGLLKKAFSAAEVRYQCYTPKVKAEMICAGVTSLIVDAALGMGIKSAVSKIQAIVKSKKALASIIKAKETGGKVDLADSAKLLNGDRKKAAAASLGRDITKEEGDAIIAAHEVGKKEGRGFGSYNKKDIAEKARKLEETKTIDTAERRALMEDGITGTHGTQGLKLEYGDAVRATGQKKFLGGFEVGNKEKIAEGLKDTKKYYGELENLADSNFKKVYTADMTGLQNVIEGHFYGIPTKDTAKTFKRFLNLNNLNPEETFRTAISTLSSEIKEFTAKVAAKANPALEYKIYRHKELKAQLMEDYFEAKYPDKYKELDFDKMNSKEQKLLLAIREELRQAREEAARRKWPMDAK